MSDAATVLVALAAAVGALAARPLPLAAAALVVAAALAWRWPVLLGVGVALATSGLAARSWAGLEPPTPRQVEGVFSLLGDPHEVAGALVVDVRVGRRHVEAWARGRQAGRLRDRLAGERVRLSGHLEAVPETERDRLAPRHVSARLTVEQVGDWSAGNPPSRLANGVRRTLLAGASSLPLDERSLFAGFVLGDDRNQPPEVAYDFRASGLTHLLVVSGENVAFVLALTGPLLRRLNLRGRLVAGVVVLGLFGTLTRWEPSVLRAVAMATISLVAATLGRPATTLRLLALAVGGLVVIDPLLVHSIGFRLSVGACVGIALLARPLARAMSGLRGPNAAGGPGRGSPNAAAGRRGPGPLAEGLAVTMAAQVGVAPVMIPTFGGLPVSALVANLLALPAAGALMVWGLAAGLPAGIVGGPLATAAHVPTRILVSWVAAVARVTAALPLGELGIGHVVAALATAALAAVALGHGRRALGGAAVAACVAVLLLPTVEVIRPRPVDARAVGRGATLWRAGQATVLVLDGARGSPDRLMSALQMAAVRNLDVLVASRPGTNEARVAEQVQRRFPAGVVLGPPHARLTSALVPPAGSDLRVGALVVHIEYEDDRLAVTVTRHGGRDPPG